MATRTLALRQKTFLDHYTDPNFLDSDGKHTFGIASRSYASAYDRSNDESSRSEGARLLTKPHIHSELERIAESLGTGVKVRLGFLRDVIQKRTEKTVKTKQYQYSTDEHGNRKRRVACEIVTVTGTLDSDGIKAVAVMNKMTGLDALHAATAEVAVREAKDLYDRIVKPKRTEKPARVEDSIRPESTQGE